MTIIYLDQFRESKVFITICSVPSLKDLYIVIEKRLSEAPPNRSAVIWHVGVAAYIDRTAAIFLYDLLREKHLTNQSTNQIVTSFLVEEHSKSQRHKINQGDNTWI